MHPGAVSTKSTVCQEVLFPLESRKLILLFFIPFACVLEQLIGLRGQNCSFAAELLFVISCPLSSSITASPSPLHTLFGGAYMHVHAASFLPSLPFPGLNSGWPCVYRMSVMYTDADAIYSVSVFLEAELFFMQQLRGVCTVQMLGCV